MSNPEIALNNSNNGTSNRWRILENYDKEQEKRVKSATNNLIFGVKHKDYKEPAEDVRNRFEKEKIEKQPTRLQKIGREILAATFGMPKAIEEKQNREAMPAALAEFDRQQEERKRIRKEQEIREEAWRQQVEQKRIEEALEREREKEEKDKEALAKEMIEGMDERRKEKLEHYKKERIQEIVERELESQLTKVDELEEQSFVEGSGVEKRSVEYSGKEIDIYDLNGYLFSMLTHAVDYKLASKDIDSIRKGLPFRPDPKHSGANTAAKVFTDPSAWNTNRSEIDDLTFRDLDMHGNTLSVSYIRSWDKSINQQVDRSELRYGFSGVAGGRLVSAYPRDGATSNKISERDIDLKIGDVEKAVSDTERGMYNELLLLRYNENGEPIKPDYIVAKNGRINEEMKKHAAYFGIPIVNINLDYYEEANKNE